MESEKVLPVGERIGNYPDVIVTPLMYKYIKALEAAEKEVLILKDENTKLEAATDLLYTEEDVEEIRNQLRGEFKEMHQERYDNALASLVDGSVGNEELIVSDYNVYVLKALKIAAGL